MHLHGTRYAQPTKQMIRKFGENTDRMAALARDCAERAAPLHLHKAASGRDTSEPAYGNSRTDRQWDERFDFRIRRSEGAAPG